MPLSAAPDWNTLLNKPTTATGFGISDFDSRAIAAQALSTFGAVGTVFASVAGPQLNLGSNVAGSSLIKVNSAGSQVSAGLSGTWRNVGPSESSTTGSTFLRVA